MTHQAPRSMLPAFDDYSQFVTKPAFPSIVSDSVRGPAASRIFARRHRLQMRRVATRSIAAEVIDLQAARDLANEVGIRSPVRVCVIRIVSALPIPIWQAVSGPLPAARLRVHAHLRHEPCQRLLVHHKPALSAAHARLENREHDEPATLRLRAWTALKVGRDTVCSFAGFEASTRSIPQSQAIVNRIRWPAMHPMPWRLN